MTSLGLLLATLLCGGFLIGAVIAVGIFVEDRLRDRAREISRDMATVDAIIERRREGER